MELAIVAVVAIAVALGGITAFSVAQERADMRRSLRTLDSYQVTAVRDQEMLESFGTRVLAPVGESISELIRRFTPDGYRAKLGQKIMLAGNPEGVLVDRLIVLKGIGAISVIAWFPLIYMIVGLTGLMALLSVVGLWAGSFMMPDISLNHQVDARKKEISRKLADLLDLLVISVEAGLGFEQALDRTASAVPGPLSDEFRRMLQETRLGSGRAEALRAMDERTDVPELRSFIMALLQADTFGVSIAKILRSQADEMRVRRRFAAQELAQKAPVKMLFPLVLCIFPAVFVIVLGPALITITESL